MSRRAARDGLETAMRSTSPAPLLPWLLLALAAAGCDSPGNERAGVTGDLGVEGASCVASPECAPPLQCLRGVCARLGGGDAHGGDADARGGDDAAAADTLELVTDIVTDYDASDWELVEDTATPRDTASGADTHFFDDCGALGISSSWSGTFAGNITFNLTAPPGLGIPSSGVMPVAGGLGFDITCVQSKFVVRGQLDGTATVVGQGEFPFTLGLAGLYDPATGRLTAHMVDGKVTIYGVLEVYFEGTFTGTLGTNGRFAGSWDGYSTGTNQEIVTGSAAGNGSWTAAP